MTPSDADPTSSRTILPHRPRSNRSRGDVASASSCATRPGGELPRFTAGAHINRAGCRTARCASYSLCNDPVERDRYVIAVKRETNGRGGSVEPDRRRARRRSIEVAPPINDFALARGAKSFIFIAGGIGITPILAMIRELSARRGALSSSSICTRSPDTTAVSRRDSRAGRPGQVVIHHDDGDPREIARSVADRSRTPNAAHIYCCGPRRLDGGGARHDRPLVAVLRCISRASPMPARRRAPTTAVHACGSRERRSDRGRRPSTIDPRCDCAPTGHDVPSSCESGTCGSAAPACSRAKPTTATWC